MNDSGTKGTCRSRARGGAGAAQLYIRNATLVLCGSEDHSAPPPENTRQMHAMIKGSRFLEIEQAGYISNIEKRAIFKYRDGEAVR
jgi:pimeloyl-ACP methyl ester carboxylesterase